MNDSPSFIEYAAAVRPGIVVALRAHVSRVFEGVSHTALDMLLHAVGGGKCLRGCLVCLFSDAFGGERDAALRRAVAIECIHAASLVHDDLLDQDRQRRDRPAVWTVAGARQAVLLGDVVLSDALRLLADCGREEARVGAGAIADLAYGAYLENEDGSDYERIIQMKTGALFAASSRLGALAAAASPAEQDAAANFGALLGQTYQVADDLQELADSDCMASGFLPVLKRFGPVFEPWGNRTTETLTPAMRDLLLQNMIAAARQRAEAALAVLPVIPVGRFTQTLRTSVREIAGMQFGAFGQDGS